MMKGIETTSAAAPVPSVRQSPPTRSRHRIHHRPREAREVDDRPDRKRRRGTASATAARRPTRRTADSRTARPRPASAPALAARELLLERLHGVEVIQLLALPGADERPAGVEREEVVPRRPQRHRPLRRQEKVPDRRRHDEQRQREPRLATTACAARDGSCRVESSMPHHRRMPRGRASCADRMLIGRCIAFTAMHSHPFVRALVVSLLIAPSPRPRLAAAAAPRRAAEPGDELTIYILTMQPGEAVFEKFGHNAIWVHDDFAARLPTSSTTGASSSSTRSASSSSTRSGSWITRWAVSRRDEQTPLVRRTPEPHDLGPGAEPHARAAPETPRLPPLERAAGERDLPLQLLHRQLLDPRPRRDRQRPRRPASRRSLTPKPTDTTFRWHTRRCTRDSLFWYAAPPHGSRPRDRPEDQRVGGMFPPAQAARPSRGGHDHRRQRRDRPAGQIGADPLPGQRPPEAATPPNWVIQFFLTGLAIAAVLVGLQHLARRKRAGRIAFAIVGDALHRPGRPRRRDLPLALARQRPLGRLAKRKPLRPGRRSRCRWRSCSR